MIEIYNTSSTFLGNVLSVSGATITVKLSEVVASGHAIINGSAYRIGQVGSFVRVPLGYQDLYGIVSEVGISAIPSSVAIVNEDVNRWMTVQLVGESIGNTFERGISQYPNVNDEVHLVTEDYLGRIYGNVSIDQVPIGRLSSAENIVVKIDLNKIVSRHSSVVGSTGSGKSTTVASLLRSIVISDSKESNYPRARIILIDIHGEYSSALRDVARIFTINPNADESELFVPYWALESFDLVNFLTGGISEDKITHFFDKIVELKIDSSSNSDFQGVDFDSITVDTPLPYSLKRMWYELIDPELRTYEGQNRDEPALLSEGNPSKLIAPQYKKHGLGSKGPFINQAAGGYKRQLNIMRSRLLDKRYDFLLHPGDWEPGLDGTVNKDLPELLECWLGNSAPITILDLSGVPSVVLIRLVGAILRIIYDAMFWSRYKSEGATDRPLLVVMEEAHRYLTKEIDDSAKAIVQRIVKEGRKYGIGAMIVSQRPSEIDETILSQCGTSIALRLSNATDRTKVQSTMPDNLSNLMELLPVLKTGEAIITGEAARLPLRCRVNLPPLDKLPSSSDPVVSEKWSISSIKEDYERVVASWRAQSPYFQSQSLGSVRRAVDDQDVNKEVDMNRHFVTSSSVQSVGYDSSSQTLEVEFQNGSIYQYYNVPEEVFMALMEASSKGKFLAYQIKNVFPYSRVG
ncbi:MAG TPA: DUF853 family protein [Solidesulfovibrio magneticus]|nr:DUF853 family protein [Solidesulfovibrio magneticus]